MSSTGPGYNALRWGRYSKAGSDYFLTLNLRRPASGLERANTTASVKSECSSMEREGLWTVRTATVMPDHMHLLVTLGDSGGISAAIRLLKGRIVPILRTTGLRWQSGFYDRLLREGDDRLPVFLYVFLNPYRAGLIDAGQTWPGFWCRAEDWEWFNKMTDADCPFPEWLR
jgi:REP element-mobilizing transposase RayT